MIIGWVSDDCTPEFRDLLGEEGHRVGQTAVHPDLVMQVGAGRSAGGADIADHVAALDVLIADDAEARKMAVLGDDAEAVVERHHVAVGAVGACGRDGRVAGREDGLAVVGGDIEAGMKVPLVREGIPAVAVTGREPAGHRPDRRGRRREGVPPLDAVTDRVEAAFDHAEQVAEHAQRGVGRPGAQQRGERGAADAAHGPRLDDRRQLVHRAAGVRVHSGPLAKLIHGRLQRRNLPHELAGRLTIAVVLDLEGLGGASEIGDGRRRTPSSPEADEDREGKQPRDGPEGGPERDRQTAHGARLAVRNDE